LRAWARGENARTYGTRSFTISMPRGYIKEPVSWRIPGGGVLHATVAHATVDATIIDVASASVSAAEVSRILDVDTAAARVFASLHDGAFRATGHRIKWHGGTGIEVRVRADKASAIGRVVAFGGRLVVVAVGSSKHDPQPVYNALLASYQPL
jgi:hypothetical protein